MDRIIYPSFHHGGGAANVDPPITSHPDFALEMSAQKPAPLVRDAAEADLPAITAIYQHHVLTGLASFEEIAPTAEEMAARRRAVLSLGAPYLVAELSGKIVGFAYANTYRARPAYRFTVEDSVYVAHDAVGRGVGDALMAELIARCEAGPFRQMIAVIGDSANAGSIALHAKHGFLMIGNFGAVGFKFGRWVDSVLMQRALGDGDATLPDDATSPGDEPGR